MLLFEHEAAYNVLEIFCTHLCVLAAAFLVLGPEVRWTDGCQRKGNFVRRRAS